MSGLTIPQKSLIMRCGHDPNGVAFKVPPVRGEALARRGYGEYCHTLRRFTLNGNGWKWFKTGVET